MPVDKSFLKPGHAAFGLFFGCPSDATALLARHWLRLCACKSPYITHTLSSPLFSACSSKHLQSTIMVMGQLGQTITVINKSGVVVKNSKQLINVLKEARDAYMDKKAELRAARDKDYDERKARKALNRLNLEENDRASRASSRPSKPPSRRHSHAQRKRVPKPEDDAYYDRPAQRRSSADRPRIDRGYTDSVALDASPPRHKQQSVHRKPIPRSGVDDPALTRVKDDAGFQAHELRRRHTEPDPTVTLFSRESSPDMDLAYGELGAPALPPRRPLDDEEQMRTKMSVLTRMLEEAHCLQHSANATIEHLQRNPDALAAVALTLAEISNIAARMAPGALTALARAFPAAMGLLMSPQFLIATGLGVGVVVVALGGYKVIKRIQDRKALEKDDGKLLEMAPELDRIEMWRRGIADAEAESVGTTVDGEFITPAASRMLIQDGRIAPEELRKPEEPSKKEKESRRENEKKHRSRRGSRMGEGSAAGSDARRTSNRRKTAKMVAKGVKMLFKSPGNAA